MRKEEKFTIKDFINAIVGIILLTVLWIIFAVFSVFGSFLNYLRSLFAWIASVIDGLIFVFIMLTVVFFGILVDKLPEKD